MGNEDEFRQLYTLRSTILEREDVRAELNILPKSDRRILSQSPVKIPTLLQFLDWRLGVLKAVLADAGTLSKVLAEFDPD